MSRLFIAVFALVLSACSVMQVTPVDPVTGYFKTNKQASTIVNKPVDLDTLKSLLLIPDQYFVQGQIENIKYFDQLITLDDLEKEIIINGLQDKITDVKSKIGINKAATAYKPFLWFRYDTRSEKNKEYGQFILTDPKTQEDIFIAEVYLDRVWAGVHDNNTWYPLFNEMIKYIEEHSKTYRK